jgi:predicted alpha/beta-hydrolase family hydrolase
MTGTEWKIGVGDESTRALYEPAAVEHQRGIYVFAHGAGGNMSDRAMLAAAKVMRGIGLGVVRFNFLYKERGSGRPDQMPKLMATTQAVVERVRAELAPKLLIIGGRSMGGRAASMLAADGFDADGLLLLAYPLHPEGAPEKLRDAHLPQIKMPVLCFNGTRDGLCTPDLMERAVKTVTAPWQMHWLDGADHSFHVLKSSGRNDAAVMVEVGSVASEWLERLPRASS